MSDYKRLTERKDYTEEEKRKHLAVVLCGMRKRCYKPNSNCYKNYGGRGIKVCNEWLGKDGQKNFYKWAIDNGYRKGMSIDRIDNNGDYTPQNCRWATPKTQAYNRSTNSYVTIHGKTQTVSEWADEIGISRGAMQNRLRYGWSEDRLLEPQQIHLKMSKHEMRVEILKLRKQAEEYQSKIENGTLIEIPCKIDDIVYEVIKGLPIREWLITGIVYGRPYGKNYVITAERIGDRAHWKFWCEDFGKSIFLTEAEAEQRLKELKNDR